MSENMSRAMVVDTFSLNGRCSSLDVFGVMCGGCVSKLLSFTIESCSGILGVCVFEFLRLNACHLVAVLLWEDFTVLDRLNGGMEMILMNLPVYCGGDVLMSKGLDLFVLDGGGLALIHSGVVMPCPTDKLGHGGLGFVHVDCNKCVVVIGDVQLG